MLNHTDTFKLTFQVVDEDSCKGVQPHQTFLRFYDAQFGEEGIQPIRATTSGKAKFELVMAKPPSSLPPTTGTPLLVTLLIGTPDYSPLRGPFRPLRSSITADTCPPRGSLLPSPIQHTFRPEQNFPPRPLSASFALTVLAPWTVFLSLWSAHAPRPKHLFSPRIFPFVATLAALEGLLF